MAQEKTALIYNGKRFSYDWLDARTLCIARMLQATAEKETLALMLRDPFEMALSVLAGLRTGLRIYLLHPASIKERVEALRRQEIPVVTDLALLPQLALPPVGDCPNGCTLVFPTSNTTSNTTRWVEIPGRNMLKKVEMLQKMLQIRENDCSYLISPLCFIQSCWTMLTHLTAGASLWIDSFSPEKLGCALSAGVVTTFVTVPSIARTLVRTVGDISSLRMLVLGGDFADQKLICDLCDKWPRLEYANVYGCTETSAADLVFGPLPLRDGAETRFSLGRPSWYSQVSILDADGNAVPAGTTGTIWIKSPFTCGHYLGTTEPLCDKDRGFCTNDIGCMDQNGFFYYLGRNVGMIKYNGIKLSCLEIESALMTCPGIREAIVFPVAHALYGQIPACCVVAEEGLTSESVKGHLQGILEPYKIPKQFFRAEQLPKTVSGKLCRNADVIAALQKQILA